MKLTSTEEGERQRGDIRVFASGQEKSSMTQPPSRLGLRLAARDRRA